MTDLKKYWPIVMFLIALTVAAAETRMTVKNNTEGLTKRETESAKRLDDLQQMQIWQATMDERTVNIIQKQHTQQQILQQILEEVRK